MDYYAPLLKNARRSPNEEMLDNFYVPQRGPLGESSVATPTTVPKKYATQEAADPLVKKPPSLAMSRVALAQEGMKHTQVPGTTDTFANVASVASNTAQGALGGAMSGAAIGLAGGPIGAAGGALIGGSVAFLGSALNAWMGNRQARAERDRQNALMADQKRVKAEEDAKDEKWRTIYHNDSLEEARYERRKFAMQEQQKLMEKQAAAMETQLASNQALKDRWLTLGFT